jgi:hypothetical protein
MTRFFGSVIDFHINGNLIGCAGSRTDLSKNCTLAELIKVGMSGSINRCYGWKLVMNDSNTRSLGRDRGGNWVEAKERGDGNHCFPDHGRFVISN